MTRERDDPEKRNLLMEQKEDKKRRQYSGSRSKPECRSCASSSSEHRKRGSPYKISSTEQRAEFNQPRTQSVPYQSEKKDSWWFWQKDQPEKKQTEDTCSCVSCALKRIVSSEYACIGCLLLLFTISIIVAFLVVFKSVPSMGGGECTTETTTTTTTCSKKKPKICDSERLKRKIEMLNENRMNNELVGLEEYPKNDKKGYDDALSGHVGIPGSAGIDFGPSFRELTSLDEPDNKASGDIDWSSVLESEKVDNSQSSNKLREFYKKLVQTDAKIKSLKKIQGSTYVDNDYGMLKSPDRSKRSLKLFNYPKKYHVIRRPRSIFNRNHRANKRYMERRPSNRTRMKRFGDDTDDPTGFVIEKKKLIVQYKPNGIKKKLPVKKCSHAPKDSHTHENQLKHPFYQNTQRLDELLDRFLNKNLPEIMSDPFGLDMLFKPDKENKCKHLLPSKNVNIVRGPDQLVDQIPKPKGKGKKTKEEKQTETSVDADIMKMLRPTSTTQYEKEFYHHEAEMIGKEKQKIITASPNDFEVLLSVSTIMNPDLKKTANQPPAAILAKIPNLRRLMQIESDDEENLGYEDFKEVLTDDMENHDDMDKPGDRRKRKDDQQPAPIEKFPKYNPPGVHNPNWKGPMPLYPDELNSMIQHAAMNANKVDIPSQHVTTIQTDSLERKGRDISDVEYVEDYLGEKYDKLVEMAQAYSDYGVLDGKKDSRNEKNTATETTDHRAKLTADEKTFSAGMFGRLKKGRLPNIVTATTGDIRREEDIDDYPLQSISQSTSDDSTEQTGGIRIEIRPTTKGRDDDFEVLKILQKHVKIQPFACKLHATSNIPKPNAVHSTLISTYPDMELVYSKTKEKTTEKITSSKDVYKNKAVENENLQASALNRGRRNLLSTDFKSTATVVRSTGSSIYKNTSAINKFVQNLRVKDIGVDNEKSLERYIERIKQKNIRIYSTAHPDLSRLKSNQGFGQVQDSLSTLTTPFKLFIADTKNLSNDSTIVTINSSEIKMDDSSGNTFQGKILLTVEDPEIGVENIDLKFNVPLVIDFNNELMMMSDNMNFPNIYNQFEIYTEEPMEPTDQNETEMDIDIGPDPNTGLRNGTVDERLKREANSVNDPADVTETPVIMPTNVTSNSSVKVNSSIKNGRYMNNSEPDMSLSDFFMMVSDWFQALDGVKVDKPRENSGSDLTEMLLKLKNSSDVNSTTDTVYPVYDSDMIENIGHRSRVLLSVENLANTTGEKKEMVDTNVTKIKGANISGGNDSNITNSSTTLTSFHSNQTTPKKNTDKKSDNVPKKDNKIKVKSVFKRNADDSSLIFWDDMYDDEYGIQTDKLDNSILRDKVSVKDKAFFKRSGRWVHDKIRKFAENLKINPRPEDMSIKERVTRSVRNPNIATYPKYIYDRIYNRLGKRDPEEGYEEDYDPEQKTIFTALSANMKEVCKKAARAVQQTRNIEVREDTKQGSIAASLMQQLVRLLTDLVDYQVQQKTCTKLPPDLQNFLEWLIHSKDEAQESDNENLTFKPFQDDEIIEDLQMQQNNDDKTMDHNQDYVTQLSQTEKQPALEVKVHYLDCLHSIQDLLAQYEEMADDEKSKMTGVKNYLDGQIKFLNKQLSGSDLFTLFEKHNQLRYKRDLHKKKIHKKRRPKRRQSKFIKNFGKKHTRTTASFDDAVTVTDMKKEAVGNKKRTNEKIDQDKDATVFKPVKRNLKDVYYKAIAEAKKYATAKNEHKKEEVTHFDSSTAKQP